MTYTCNKAVNLERNQRKIVITANSLVSFFS